MLWFHIQKKYCSVIKKKKIKREGALETSLGIY